MKKCYFFFSFLIFFLGCSADINVSSCEIDVKQGNIDIHSKTGTFDFGNTPSGLSQSVLFTIENNGLTTLNITGLPIVKLAGTSTNDFSVDTTYTETNIAAGYSTTFLITFNPKSIGFKNAKIIIENNDRNENPYSFSITGVGTPPAPEINVKQYTTDVLNSTGSYDFGDFFVNNESPKIAFIVQNTGNEILHLTGNPLIAIDGQNNDSFIIDQAITQSVINEGGQTTFFITFKPTSDGLNTATIIIQNDDSDENPYTFTVTGTGVATPEINIKFENQDIQSGYWNYDFGKIYIGESSNEIILTIENHGSMTLHLSGQPDCIAFEGADASNFSANVTSTNKDIQPGESTTFGITFNAINKGERKATVKIENNDADENPFTFTVKGFGITPEMNVWQDSTIIKNSVGVYDFSRIRIGFTSPEVTFSIENIGTGDLILDGSPVIQKSGTDTALFDIDQTATVTTLKPNESTTFTISFTPTTAGNFSIIISIDNNDLDEDPYTFEVKGEGVESQYFWTKQFGAGSYDQGNAVTTDSSGNIYLVGSFRGTVNFGAEFGATDNITAFGNDDTYLMKVNANGTYGWTKHFGGNVGVYATCIQLDSNENIYIAGVFRGTINFGRDFSTTDTKSYVGDLDAFITKINANGTYGWTKQFGDQEKDYITSISISTSYVYIVGYFEDTVNFGGDFNRNDYKTSNGQQDIFLTKIGTNSNYYWTAKFGSVDYDQGLGVTTDSAGNILLAGYIGYQANFGADFGTSDIKNDAGAFLTKINANATYNKTWLIKKTITYSITTDSADNIFLAGSYRDPTNFAEDFGATDYKSSGSYGDIFVTKINTNMSYGWTKVIGGDKGDECHSIAADGSGNVYITGYFRSKSINFGKDFSTTDVKTAKSDQDTFLTKIKSDGSYGWTVHFGGTGDEYGLGCAADSKGFVYVIGYFESTINFAADFNLIDSKTANGYRDAFITKLSQSK